MVTRTSGYGVAEVYPTAMVMTVTVLDPQTWTVRLEERLATTAVTKRRR